MKLRIVWPEKTLFKYNDADGMDITIDDEIFPAIMRPIISENIICKTQIHWNSSSKEPNNLFTIEIDLFHRKIEWQKIIEEIKKIKMDLDVKVFQCLSRDDYDLVYSDFDNLELRQPLKTQRKRKKKK